MENTVSRLLIETTVRQTLKGLQEDPKRSVRNLVDMALQFSKGRFQSRFFETAYVMLKKQDSAYYDLIQDATNHIETEHLVQFGMNLGYNSCTWGAKRIRTNEERLGFNIPWTVLFTLEGSRSLDRLVQYHKAIVEGEQLGIYTWIFFLREVDVRELLPLLREHPYSAFFLCCSPDAVNESVVKTVGEFCNLMLAVRCGDGVEEACLMLRDARLPYAVWFPYEQQQIEAVTSGELFDRVQHLHPIFTALMPCPGCRPETQAAACEAVEMARDGQNYTTIPWELYTDTCRLDEIISDDACWAFFDSHGELYMPYEPQRKGEINLFHGGLTAALRQAYPKVSTIRHRCG